MGERVQENQTPNARISPLGERSILIRFDDRLSLAGNNLARNFASKVRKALSGRILECVSNLVSVQIAYDPLEISYADLRGELMLLAHSLKVDEEITNALHHIKIRYDEAGVRDVSQQLDLSPRAFVKYHSGCELTALALGFSPGFLYLGLHGADYVVPRKKEVQNNIPAGSVLFAAGQTAITSRPIRTGWHVIGHTDFSNFDATKSDPVTIMPGDQVTFEAVQV